MKYLWALLVFVVFMSCKTDTSSTSSSSEDELADQVDVTLNDPALLYKRAMLYYDKKDYALAVADLQKAIGLDSLQPQYYHLLSDAQLDSYDSRAALETMDTASRLFSDRLPTLLKLTELQYILKQYSKALGTINHIFYLEKEDAETFYMLGVILNEQGEEERAVNVLKEAVDRDPDLTDAWTLLGVIAEKNEDPIARTYYENAMRLAPQSSTAKHNLAYYIQNHGDIPGAIKLYRQIAVQDRFYAPAFLNMGVLYSELDSLDLALEQFNILINIKPQDPVGYYYSGLVYEAKGDTSTARQQYTSALQLNSTFDQARQALARIR